MLNLPQSQWHQKLNIFRSMTYPTGQRITSHYKNIKTNEDDSILTVGMNGNGINYVLERKNNTYENIYYNIYNGFNPSVVSSDRNGIYHFAVSGNVLNFIKRTERTFTSFGNTTITNMSARCMDTSSDGVYTYVGGETGNFLSLIKRTGDSLSITNNLSTSWVNGIKFSPDGTYLLICFKAGTPTAKLYKRGTYGYNQISFSTSSLSYPRQFSCFSTNNNFLAIKDYTGDLITSYIKIFKRTVGDTFNYIQSIPFSNQNVTSFTLSNDGTYLFATVNGSVYFQLYKYNGSSFNLVSSSNTIFKTDSKDDMDYMNSIFLNTKNQIILSKHGQHIRSIDIVNDTMVKTDGTYDYLKNANFYSIKSSRRNNDIIALDNYQGKIRLFKKENNMINEKDAPAILNDTMYTYGKINFSEDGRYMVIIGGGAPYINVFNTSTDTYTKITTNFGLTEAPYFAMLSNDGVYLTIGVGSSPFIKIYKNANALSGGGTDSYVLESTSLGLSTTYNNSITMLNDTYQIYASPNKISVIKKTGTGTSCTFTPLTSMTVSNLSEIKMSVSTDDKYLVVSSGNTPYFYVYKRTGDTFTQLTLAITAVTYVSNVCFINDNTFIASTYPETNGPFMNAYVIENDIVKNSTLKTDIDKTYSYDVDFDKKNKMLTIADSTTVKAYEFIE